MNHPNPETILDALAFIEAQITGVSVAYGYPPATIPRSDTPAFINLPGPATVDWQGAGEDADGLEGLETRQYYCIILVAAMGEGASDGEAMGRCIPFLSRFRDVIAANPSLGQSNPYTAFVTGDGGVQANLEYNGVGYYGIRFTVSVTGRVRALYESNN